MNLAVAGQLVERALRKDHKNGRMLGELWEYRELFYFFAWRDIKIRYKQTALGVLWAVIQPLFTMAVFTVVFGQMAKIPSEGLPGPVFYFSALLPWIYFSSTLNTGGMSLVANSNLLTKIYFPRIILPAAAALGGLLDLAIGSVLLAALILYYHLPLTWHLLLWPVLVVPLVLLAFGISAFIAALNVKYRDIKYAIPFAIQLLLFVTPIIYPASIIPERFRWVLAVNPLSGLIESFRYVVDPRQVVHWQLVYISLGMTVFITWFGLVYFKRTERAFADIV